MELYEIEQEFNKVWNRADYKQKKQILQEIERIINRKESERNQAKTFFEAVQNKNILAVKNILDQGVDVNLKEDVLGNTALSNAVIARNIDIIKILLEKGADPRIENNKGYCAIDAAKLMGNDEIIKLLS